MKKSVQSLLLAASMAALATSAPAQQSSPHRNNQQQQGRQQQGQQQQQGGPRQQRSQPQQPNRPPVQIDRYSGPDNYRRGVRPPPSVRNREANIEHYRRNYRSARRYRVRPYVQPRGWYERRWVFGDILPGFFWRPTYWITNWWYYGLPIPPAGYIWVRYGNDALLVQRSTGRILMVIYDIFYW
jgi:Ni/Co efflux regulator RcnB